MLHFIIIDNRPVARIGIKYFLTERFIEVNLIEFESIEEFRLAIPALSPDLILLGADVHFEGVSLYKLKLLYPESKLIVYDSEVKTETGIICLESGAHGYLSRQSDIDMLINCIETVLEGRFYIDPAGLNTLLNGLVHTKQAQKNELSAFH